MTSGRYGITAFGEMVGDEVRMTAYERALRRAVRPGSVVLDIGTGTGIFALLACRFGAARVYAVEPDDAIAVAREIALANGVADRVTFAQALSTQLTLPEPVDVIVSDLRGVLPLFGRHLPSVVDARDRFLRPGGTLIPERDTLWTAAAAAPELFARRTEAWTPERHGFDMTAARALAVNSWTQGRIREEQLLTAARRWAVLDYTTLDSPDCAGTVTCPVQREGEAHGLAVWFDTELGGGGFSNAPWAPELIYGRAWFPWPEAVRLRPGDEVRVEIHADLVRDDYLWRWSTEIRGPDGAVQTRFEQSDLEAVPLDVTELERLAPEHRPGLSEEGLVQRLVLERMDGRHSLQEIAEELRSTLPHLAPGAVLDRVREVSRRYGS